MKSTFQLLAQIQPAAPERDLWQDIVAAQRRKQLPFVYVATAAACFMLFVSAELFFIQQQTEIPNTFLSNSNNMLYDE